MGLQQHRFHTTLAALSLAAALLLSTASLTHADQHASLARTTMQAHR